MNSLSQIRLLTIIALLLSIASCVQQPGPDSMSMAGKGDCAMMNDMDHGKMDMKDPKMKAMMEHCMDDSKLENNGTGGADSAHTETEKTGDSEHNH